MTAQALKQCVGLDVASESVEAAFSILTEDLKPATLYSLSFPNTPVGFEQFKQWCWNYRNQELPLYITMESTGVYHEKLCRFTYLLPGVKVSVVLPNKARRFAQSLEGSSKTDKIDARSMSLMGLSRELRPWSPPKESNRMLRRLTREKAFLKKQQTAMKNLLHAMCREYGGLESSQVRIGEVLAATKNAIKAIDKEIRELIKKDDLLGKDVMLLTSIPGVGVQTAAVVLAETNSFEQFGSGRQLSCYAGLDVRLKESGKWKGKSRISKCGNAHIRGALYMPSMSIVSHQVPMAATYQRLITQRGKLPMVALTALSRKLLLVMYAIWKSRVPYNPSATEHPNIFGDCLSLDPPSGKKKQRAKPAAQDGLR